MKAIPLFLLLAWAGSANAADDVVGHYYLSGVMEVGSELLLKEDGRFQWYVSYGAMDQQAEGRWQQTDGKITLLADQPVPGQPWASLQGSRDWNEEADYAWRRQAYVVQMKARDARCPFLHGIDTDVVAAVATPAMMETSTVEDVAETENQPSLEQAIAAQETRLAGFVRRAEETAASAMAATGAAREPAMQAAAQAMSDYWKEQYALKDLYWQRSGPIPDYVALTLPPACTAPAEPSRESTAAEWMPRDAVEVRDGDGMYFSGLPITLLYADGLGESLVTQDSGYAFAGHVGGAMPITVRIGGEEQARAGFPPLTISVPADARRVLQVELDTRAIAGPGFETMELRIDGRDLIPIWHSGQEQGRYSRD